MDAATKIDRDAKPIGKPGFFVYTPKGKKVVLKGKGLTATLTTKNGKPGIVFTEEEADGRK